MRGRPDFLPELAGRPHRWTSRNRFSQTFSLKIEEERRQRTASIY